MHKANIPPAFHPWRIGSPALGAGSNASTASIAPKVALASLHRSMGLSTSVGLFFTH